MGNVGGEEHTVGGIGRVCRTVDHDHESGMALEDVVCKWNDHDYGCGRGAEGEAGKAFDEGCEKGGREMTDDSREWGVRSLVSMIDRM